MSLLSVPSTWPTRLIASNVLSGSSAWHQGPKEIEPVTKVAIRRLLPAPSVVERKPIVLGAMRWVDVAGRALRRSWIAHWRRQYVEVLPLADIPQSVSPPPRPPRSMRSHHRWSWHDRLACNAWWGPPQWRITVAGVPAFLITSEQ